MKDEDRSIKSLKRFQELASLYSELLYAVEKKFPNETRHQTALRYIRERELSGNNESAKEEKP